MEFGNSLAALDRRTVSCRLTRGRLRLEIGVVTCLAFAACSNGGNGDGLGGASRRDVCTKLNDAQRAATALEGRLDAATSNDQAPSLLTDATALDAELSSALASGAFAGDPVNDHLQTAIQTVKAIETDLNKPDIAKAALDDGALKNAMIQLGQDCSQYLS